MSNISLWKRDLYRDDMSFNRLQKIANQMFNNFFRECEVLDKNGNLLPTCDFYETDKDYRLSMELPGICKEDIDVSISGDTLNIKGEKKYEKESEERKYYCLERSYGSFYRAINLPLDTDKENIAVSFSNGVLEVTIRKSAQSSVKKIDIS
ncbi:Hsp20/alpha crystallin family protein [Wolbachia endosymbiont of Anurida maritima]|uniref:Hsp20/alpha crystallin family protein n=1 Tax=Wolbachia endosymbiont of Anurida maritima TaxID=2850562 RepID=UPI0035CFB557